MRYSIILLTLCAATVLACHKKTLPSVSTRTSQPAAPQTRGLDVIPDTIAGKSIFAGSCNRCHGLPQITLYSAKRWEGILAAMIPKARLNNDQGIHLKAYIKGNCIN